MSALVSHGSQNKQIGDYIYSDLIGRGSSAKVYRGQHIGTGELVAVKKMSKSAVGQLFTERVKTEIALLSRLDHQNIVGYRAMVESDRHIYIIQEYCSGGDLKAHMRVCGAFSQLEAKYYFAQIRDAMTQLAAQNIVHRDLKPQNLLLHFTKSRTSIKYEYRDIQIKLADFGLAKEVIAGDLQNTLVGSPLYLPPETILDGYTHPRSDLWSLGIILYKLVFGIYPYGEPSNLLELVKTIEKTTIRYPRKISCCLHLRHLLNGLLQKNPELRLSWEEFFTAPWFDCDSRNCDPSSLFAHDSSSSDDEEDALHRDIPEVEVRLDERPQLDERYCDRPTLSMSIPIAVPVRKQVTIATRPHADSISDSIYSFIRKYASGGGVA